MKTKFQWIIIKQNLNKNRHTGHTGNHNNSFITTLMVANPGELWEKCEKTRNSKRTRSIFATPYCQRELF